MEVTFEPTDNGLGVGHGFAISGYDETVFLNGAMVGAPKTVKFRADRAGKFTLLLRDAVLDRETASIDEWDIDRRGQSTQTNRFASLTGRILPTMKLKSLLTFVAVAPLMLAGCNSDSTAKHKKAAAQAASAAQQVYVAPGKLDDYYAFLSGGQSGSVFVYGIPSCRFIKEIPIFEPRAALGYANNPGSETFKRLAATGPLWGDTHHPVLSQTDGRYDGHWLWINDKANGRVAKIDLRTFEAVEIKVVPNIQGAHGLAAYLPTCKYVFVNGELEMDAVSNSTDAAKYRSMVAFLDAQTLETKFEVSFVGNADIASSGKDGHYVFFTMYNTENATTSEGMIERDRDAVGAIDVPLAEKTLAEGKFTRINGVPVIESEKVPGVLTEIPVPKNPHGCNVTPDGKYVLASGKLSPTVSIIDAKTLKVIAEPEVGLGPLHTTFDGRGNAYTSLFVDSQIVKWNIEKAIKGDPGLHRGPGGRALQCRPHQGRRIGYKLPGR